MHSGLEGFCTALGACLTPSATSTDIPATSGKAPASSVKGPILVTRCLFPRHFGADTANAQDAAALCEELWALPGKADEADRAGAGRRDAFERDWLGENAPWPVSAPARPGEIAAEAPIPAHADAATATAAAAVSACVARNLYAPGPSGTPNPLWLLANNAPLGPEGTPALDRLLGRILSETCAGLLAEGFEADDVRAWQLSLRELVSSRWDALSLEACTPGGPARHDLLRTLVAGVVYGPAHPLAKLAV